MKNEEIKISREQRTLNSGTPCPPPTPTRLSKSEIKILNIEREKEKLDKLK